VRNNPKTSMSANQLREVLNYDPETGVFTWKVRAGARGLRGSVAGSVDPSRRGYRRIKIRRKFYAAHRLAWLYVYGTWPLQDIDHVNGATDDNRISNLRTADFSQNAMNRVYENHPTGVIGVTHAKTKSGGFVASIFHYGKSVSLGTYATLEAATAARRAGEAIYHKQYAGAASRCTSE